MNLLICIFAFEFADVVCRDTDGSLATSQRHIVTSPDTFRHWRQTFLTERLMLLFLVHLEVFNKPMSQAISSQ